ncbi:hypothetical protein [uncultured Sphingomonas sp.]|uniref:hypothetical protein n=1 Tax=uncultured Sphingomonas sp. TaxID=158754 RepID=UPI0026030E10|nr:hypothetical protein [uncultured Sphingomonas sp.]
MRVSSIALALPLLALAACGGAGPESVGSIAPPASAGGTTGGGTGVGTPGTGTGSTSPSNLLAVSTATSFTAIGALHSFTFSDTGQLYQGNASTVKVPSGTISYDPRDGVFTVALTDEKAGFAQNNRFQDPAHRADYNPEATPNLEAPNLAGFNYLESGTSTETTSFFYQRPGDGTYVTLAGFTRSVHDDKGVTNRQHGALVFGTPTIQSQIPISGTGSYTGGFLASAVLNDGTQASSYMQWLTGTSAVSVDFGRSTVDVRIDGAVGPTFQNGVRVSDAALTNPTGTAFQAVGSAKIDLLRYGGFSGAFTSATLGGKAIDFTSAASGTSTAGASSIDGTFFGPNAANVGGNFRIVGGVPGQRIDIQGAFTGKK